LKVYTIFFHLSRLRIFLIFFALAATAVFFHPPEIHSEETDVSETDAIENIRNTYICPDINISIRQAEEAGLDCPQGYRLIELVGRIINNKTNAADIELIAGLFPHGKQLLTNIAGKTCPINGKLNIELFIMSGCPHGNKFVKETFFSLLNDFSDYVIWQPHYIVHKTGDGKLKALHGESELSENLRQVCIRDKWGLQQWLGYVDCFNREITARQTSAAGRDWTYCSRYVDIEPGELSNCVKYEAEQLILKDVDKTLEYSVNGSPTVIFNCSMRMNGYNSYSSIKPTLCSLMGEPKPAACNEQER